MVTNYREGGEGGYIRGRAGGYKTGGGGGAMHKMFLGSFTQLLDRTHNFPIL